MVRQSNGKFDFYCQTLSVFGILLLLGSITFFIIYFFPNFSWIMQPNRHIWLGPFILMFDIFMLGLVSLLLGITSIKGIKKNNSRYIFGLFSIISGVFGFSINVICIVNFFTLSLELEGLLIFPLSFFIPFFLILVIHGFILILIKDRTSRIKGIFQIIIGIFVFIGFLLPSFIVFYMSMFLSSLVMGFLVCCPFILYGIALIKSERNT